MATIQNFRERVRGLNSSTASTTEPKFNGHAAFGFGFRSLFHKRKLSKDSEEVWYTIPTILLRRIFFECDVVGAKCDKRCSSIRSDVNMLLYHLETASAKYPPNYETTSKRVNALEWREKALIRSLERYVDATHGTYANNFTEAEALAIVNKFLEPSIVVIHGYCDRYTMSMILNNPETPLESSGFFYFDWSVVDASISDDKLKEELECINTAQMEADFIDWLNNIDMYCGRSTVDRRKFKPFCKWYALKSDDPEAAPTESVRVSYSSADFVCDTENPEVPYTSESDA